jgi:hypothetical protein
MTNTQVTSPVDQLFTDPYIDVDEWRDTPSRHRYVHGGFRGGDTRFSFYFPESDRYRGRFFQYVTPAPDSETVSQGLSGEEDRIGFALDGGAYFVETNGGGPGALNPFAGLDPSVGAFRANAEAAGYSRRVAKEMYGDHRPFGYAFGGSGGGFRTMSGAENTNSVWDGTVPYVIGSPMAIPNCFTARMQALRVLRHRFDSIVDALEPGGSGDPYAELDENERSVLSEVTRLGFPIHAWFGHKTMGLHGLSALYPGVRAADPSYFDDFWTTPGYLGADPVSSVQRDRVQLRTRVTEILDAPTLLATGVDRKLIPGLGKGTADDGWLGAGGAPPIVAVRLAEVPLESPTWWELLPQANATAGSRLVVLNLVGDVAIIGPGDSSTLELLETGEEIVLDNSGFLALETYHRHQVPALEDRFSGYDQFRDKNGNPLYPQRPMLLGPLFAPGIPGAGQTGRINGKMIVVASHADREAYPWQADWYRRRVQQQLGADADNSFRLWYTEHALHDDASDIDDQVRSISYLGVLQQALRDISAWVEDDIDPAATTSYEIRDAQLELAAPLTRAGIQPTVSLEGPSGASTSVSVGQPVTLHATAATPDKSRIVAFEWDGDADGRYEHVESVPAEHHSSSELTVRFDRPGDYFPAVRVVSRRDSTDRSPFARMQNVARVRIVVKA